MPLADLLLLLPVLLSGSLTGSIAVYLLARRRQVPGASAYAAILLGEAWWAFGHAGELHAATLPAKVAWDAAQLLAIPAISTGMLVFALQFAGRAGRRPWLLVAAVAALQLPAVAWILHGAILGNLRAAAVVEPAAPFGALVYPFHPVEQILFAFTYLLTGAALVVVGEQLVRQHRRYRAQVALVLIGLGVPVFGSMVTVALDLAVLGQRDTSPYTFGVCAALVLWGLWRGDIFDLVPVARDLVLEQLADAVLVLDVRGRVVDLNPAAQRLLGAAGAEAVGREAAEALAPWPELARAVAEGGRQVRLPGGAGGEATYDVRVAGLGGRGGPVGRAVVLRDVSDRQRAEEGLQRAQAELEQRVQARTAELTQALASLRESERRFRGVFDGTFQLIGLLDLEGRLLEANRAALEFAGADEAQVAGRWFWDTPWWTHAPGLQASLRRGVAEAAGGRFVRFPVDHPDRDGRLQQFDFSIKPVLDDQGRPTLLVVEGRDVTELHAAEAARRQLQAQLLQAQKLESIGRLAGGVAHDFNNLLTSILGNASMALEELGPASPVAESLAEILHAGQSAAALTRQLLAFGRKQPVDPKVVDLNQSLERVRGVLVRTLGAEVKLQTALAPGLWPILIDPVQLEQVVLNLAVNARDAMPSGGGLTLETSAVTWDAAAARRHGEGAGPGDWVRLAVRDTGVGMTAEVLAHAFEPFFTTKPEGQGTGLGLATVYGVVRQHGGLVEVSSAPGQGSTFEVYLPRADAPVRPEAHREGRAAPGGLEHVMVVEDQEQVRHLAAIVLGRLGYRVEVHADPALALRALEAGPPPALLLTDVSMPGMSGGALARAARQLNPQLRVLYMSGHLDDAVARLGVETGETRLLQKPFTPDDLAAAVRRELDAPPPAVAGEG